MEQRYFIGVDLSKSKVDVFVVDSSCHKVLHEQLPNNEGKLKSFLKALLKTRQAITQELLVCCEHTGIYGQPLMRACHAVNVPLWVENALLIKKASTQLRGKSDLLDSQRIAEYALRYGDRQRLHQPKDPSSKQVQDLLHARESLIDSINRLEKQINESKQFDKELHATLNESFRQSIRVMKNSLAKIELRLKQVVAANAEMQRNVQLASSVKGIGLIVAMNLVVATDNFRCFETARQFACYAGVVPFPNESGTLIKRPRVSRYANKQMKSLLHMGAIAAIRSNPQLKQYYERKVAEGKNKMLVLNAVRNKLIHIVWAVIKRGTPYTTTLQPC